MKNTLLFILILSIAVAGATGLFYLQSRIPNNELVNSDVNAQLLKIDNLDSSINELVLRSRANLDSNYDMLARSTTALERTIVELSETYFNVETIAGSLLEKRFSNFEIVMENKLDQVEHFKSNNSVLRNSDKYTPLVGVELSQIAKDNQLLSISSLYQQITIDILEFTKQSSVKSVNDVEKYTSQISETEKDMPEDSLVKIIEFNNHVSKAIDAKQKTDLYLTGILDATSNTQIEEILSAWNLWQIESNQYQKVLRYYTIAYVFIILALIAFLVYRLRLLYINLDQEVDAKTLEVKAAYEELQSSERQLAQDEKVDSLGETITNILEKINEPLRLVTSNINKIKSKSAFILPIVENATLISNTVSDPSHDRGDITKLLKQQIIEVRKIKAGGNDTNIKENIQNVKQGIENIQKITESFSSYSNIHSGSWKDMDINECVIQAMTECSQIIGDRKLVSNLDSELQPTRGMQAEIIDGFKKVIINAVNSTDEKEGTISIETSSKGAYIEIKISDNGVGLDRESLKDILEPMTSPDSSLNDEDSLSSAHLIFEAHHGSLKLSSDTIAGTIVKIQLPVAVN